MKQEGYLEWTLLRHIPDIYTCIIGLSNGEVKLVTDDAVYYFRHLICSPVFTNATSTAYIVPITPKRSFYFDDELIDPGFFTLETEEILLRELLVAGKYTVRCGYGPRTKTWVVAKKVER